MERTVWTTGTRHGHVHASPDCHGARTSAHRTRAEYVEVPMSQVPYAVPCRRCFPDLPTLKIWHPICRICQQSRPLPCPHNGAVRVLIPRRGGTHPWRTWVWAENAWRYDLVEPLFAE